MLVCCGLTTVVGLVIAGGCVACALAVAAPGSASCDGSGPPACDTLVMHAEGLFYLCWGWAWAIVATRVYLLLRDRQRDAPTSDAAVEGFRAALGSVEQLEELLAKVAEDELGGRVSATGLRKLAKKIGHPDPAPQVLAAILTAVDIDGDGAVPPQDAVVFARGLVPGGERLGSLWRDVRGVVQATRYDVTQLDEQLFRKYDTNGDGSISLRKFRATLEKVAQKTGSTLDVPWELVQAIWGVPERVDYVTFCSWLNPTKLHRLKQKASKLAARSCRERSRSRSCVLALLAFLLSSRITPSISMSAETLSSLAACGTMF